MSGEPTKSPAVTDESSSAAAGKPKATAKGRSSKFGKIESSIRHFRNRLVGVVIASFLFGCLIAICQPPEKLPVTSSPGSALAVMQVIAQAKASRGGDVAELSEADVNDYLAQRTAPSGFFLGSLCRFDGVMVSFQPKTCLVFSRYTFFGYPVYLSGAYTARDDYGRPAFNNRGGSIGRLAIAPFFMGMAQYLFFGELWKGFGIERETLNRFREVEFELGVVKLIPEQ